MLDYKTHRIISHKKDLYILISHMTDEYTMVEMYKDKSTLPMHTWHFDEGTKETNATHKAIEDINKIY